MTLLHEPGFDFGFDPSACADCPGHCCRGEPGRIWVSPPEIQAIAAFLKIPAVDLIHRHLVKAGNRWSIAERTGADEMICMFFDVDRRRCRIYPVRPEQCRRFPFWEAVRGNPGAFGECIGIRTEDQPDLPDGL